MKNVRAARLSLKTLKKYLVIEWISSWGISDNEIKVKVPTVLSKEDVTSSLEQKQLSQENGLTFAT